MKKFSSLILVIVLIICSTLIIPLTVSATVSQADAISWADSKVGLALDYDGAYGAQCVDLIAYYLQYLGQSSLIGGNASNYSNKTLPSGWSYVKFTSGCYPQAGDIVIWSLGYGGNSAGHVAIAGEGSTSSRWVLYSQNPGATQKVSWSGGLHCGGSSMTVWGFMRPSFGTQPHVHLYSKGYEADHPHRVYMKCSCGNYYYTGETESIADTCEACRTPGKPVFKNLKRNYELNEPILLEWDNTSNTTHYSIFVKEKETSKYAISPIFYAKTGTSITLPIGEYLIQVTSTNSNYWTSDGSTWLYTDGDWIDFSVGCSHKNLTLVSSVPATCVEKGLKKYTCENCEATISEDIPAKGHVAGDIVRENIIPNTCTSNGSYDEVVYCETCMEEIRRTEKVLYAQHTEKILTTIVPTCTEQGYDILKCVECGVRRKDNVVQALGHNYVFDRTVAPTCEKGGYDVYTCTRCNDFYTDNSVSATGHNYHQTRTILATCVKDGYFIYTCSNCNDSYNTIVPALDHYFIGGACADCGVSEKDAPYDVNGDTIVNAFDLVMLRKALLLCDTRKVYDVNKDGCYDVRDLIRFKKYMQ